MNKRNARAKVTEIEPYSGPRTITELFIYIIFFNPNNSLVQILPLEMNKPKKSKNK